MKKILVDDTLRELTEHGTEFFPMTVSHDDLWAFEGKKVPVHWHQDLENGLPQEGEIIYQIFQQSYAVHPGEGILLNSNVPHSCHSPGNSPARYTTVLIRPDFLYGTFGSDVERNCFRPFLQNSRFPCILLTDSKNQEHNIFRNLELIESLYDEKSYCYELKIKGLLCDIFSQVLCTCHADLTSFAPSNQLDLERLEQMLTYLHTHFDSVISLQDLAEQIHLSREVSCRLFRKMTGKTITAYLEEYRALKSLPFVQCGQYSMTQIADMTGFSNASRFALAFRRQFGCNPGEYNSLTHEHYREMQPELPSRH